MDAVKNLRPQPECLPRQTLDAPLIEADEGGSDEDTSDEAYIAKHEEAAEIEQRLRNMTVEGSPIVSKCQV